MIRKQFIISPQIIGTLAFILTASVLFTLQAGAQQSKTAAEYLIVEHSNQLLIYNKYQQRITKQENEVFIPFVPLRVLEFSSLLNDNYTPCMKVEFNGGIYYLIKNDRTALIGSGKLGLNQIYRSAVLLQDTVQIMTKSGAVLISPDYTKRSALQKGEKIIRYFQDGDLTYIRPLVMPLRFGWARLEGIARSVPLPENELDNHTNAGIHEKTLERIEMKFREVNTLLTNIFMYFNKQSNQKKTIPQWHSVQYKKRVAYILEPQLYSSYFPESDRYLARDLDNMLLGTAYSIIYKPGKIEIQQK